jgi:hypothetical protein
MVSLSLFAIKFFLNYKKFSFEYSYIQNINLGNVALFKKN